MLVPDIILHLEYNTSKIYIELFMSIEAKS